MLENIYRSLNAVLCVEVLCNERIISSSADKTIKIWNVKTGNCLHRVDLSTCTCLKCAKNFKHMIPIS